MKRPLCVGWGGVMGTLCTWRIVVFAGLHYAFGIVPKIVAVSKKNLVLPSSQILLKCLRQSLLFCSLSFRSSK